MIEVFERDDGWWGWRWTEDGQSFLNSKSYSSPEEAAASASRAYPGEAVVAAGSSEDRLTGAPAGDARYAKPERRSRKEFRGQGGPAPGTPSPPSGLWRLVILGLVFLRSRGSGGRSRHR